MKASNFIPALREWIKILTARFRRKLPGQDQPGYKSPIFWGYAHHRGHREDAHTKTRRRMEVRSQRINRSRGQ